MAKFEYKFVRVRVAGGVFAGHFDTTPYRREIENHARRGWRFVQAFAPSVSTYGRGVDADLIFEREVEQD